MKRDLAMAFSRVTEGAALAGYKWLGRGDKNAADGAAVEVMRILLNKTDISGEIVIGEGEIDDAPMLYICLLYTSPSPRDKCRSRMPSSA